MADDTDTDRTDAPLPPDDIRSALTAALAEQETAPPDAPERPDRQPADDREPADRPESRADRARGPDGKFIRAEGDEPPEAPDRPGARRASPESTPPETKSPETADDPLAKATAKWSEADRTMLRGLPAPAQEFVLRRQREADADYTRKTQEIAREREQLSGFRQQFEPVAQIFAPYRDQMAARGFTPESMIRAWHNVEQRLVQGDGVNVVKGLVDGYRLDRQQVAHALGLTAPAADGQPAPEAPQHAQIPPELLQRLSAHEAWIMQQDQYRQAETQRQQQQSTARVMSDIEQFASATDKAGAPLHPHFRDVEEDMTRLVHAARASGGPVPSLSDLYDQAVWANTSTRQQMLDRERAAHQAQHTAAEETRRKEARAHAERSRRAGASVTGSPGNGSQAPARGRSNGSVRDDIAAAMEDLEA